MVRVAPSPFRSAETTAVDLPAQAAIWLDELPRKFGAPRRTVRGVHDLEGDVALGCPCARRVDLAGSPGLRQR